MSSTTDFEYQPLTCPDDLRVVRLLPALEKEGPLRIHITHCEYYGGSSTNAYRQVYEAVSYTWGTDTATTKIPVECNGTEKILEIRHNVAKMLRYLRDKEKSRDLWIDAICINQRDLSEKEHQVRHMGRVYANAAKVLIWVEPHSRFATTYDHFEKWRLLNEERKASENASDLPSEMVDPEWYTDENLANLRSFIRSPWFFRRWVIQEAAHAHNAVLVCGNLSFDFSKLMKQVIIWLETRDQKSKILSIIDRTTLYRLRATIRLQERNISGERKCKLIRMLIDFEDTRCSDARDAFYALNSLSSDPVPVSYSQPTLEVYRDFALREFKCDPTQLLGCAGAFRPKLKHWPTWVPDWAYIRTYIPLPSNIPRISLILHEPRYLCLEGRELVVEAIFAGRVRTQLDFHNDSHRDFHAPVEDPQKIITRWYSAAVKACDLFSIPVEPILSTLFSEALSLGEERFSIVDILNGQSSEPPSCLQKIISMMKGRTGFFTELGEFGIGPRTLTSGDILVQFSGSPFLIALRPCKGSSKSAHFPVIEDWPNPKSLSGAIDFDFCHSEASHVVGDCHVPQLTWKEDMWCSKRHELFKIQ